MFSCFVKEAHLLWFQTRGQTFSAKACGSKNTTLSPSLDQATRLFDNAASTSSATKANNSWGKDGRGGGLAFSTTAGGFGLLGGGGSSERNEAGSGGSAASVFSSMPELGKFKGTLTLFMSAFHFVRAAS
jgi:hypothetical protein